MSGDTIRVRLDLNNPVFQDHWFRLEKVQQLSVLSALRKLATMTWNEVQRDHGLKWK